jgi:hypothetical protein
MAVVIAEIVTEIVGVWAGEDSFGRVNEFALR